MNSEKSIYGPTGLNKENIKISVFHSKNLTGQCVCLFSNSSDFKKSSKYNIYDNESLLRILTKKSATLAKDALEQLYGQKNDDSLTLVHSWGENEYLYSTIQIEDNEVIEMLQKQLKALKESILSYISLEGREDA